MTLIDSFDWVREIDVKRIGKSIIGAIGLILKVPGKTDLEQLKEVGEVDGAGDLLDLLVSIGVATTCTALIISDPTSTSSFTTFNLDLDLDDKVEDTILSTWAGVETTGIAIGRFEGARGVERSTSCLVEGGKFSSFFVKVKTGSTDFLILGVEEDEVRKGKIGLLIKVEVEVGGLEEGSDKSGETLSIFGINKLSADEFVWVSCRFFFFFFFFGSSTFGSLVTDCNSGDSIEAVVDSESKVKSDRFFFFFFFFDFSSSSSFEVLVAGIGLTLEVEVGFIS